MRHYLTGGSNWKRFQPKMSNLMFILNRWTNLRTNKSSSIKQFYDVLRKHINLIFTLLKILNKYVFTNSFQSWNVEGVCRIRRIAFLDLSF